jgi:hypothetical protein
VGLGARNDEKEGNTKNMVVISWTASTVVRHEVSIQNAEVRHLARERLLRSEYACSRISPPDLTIKKKEYVQTQVLTSHLPLTAYKLLDM